MSASIKFWTDKDVLVTGGASFIGSHIVDKLVQSGAKVTVVDNLSSGRLANLRQSRSKITFIKADLEYIRKEELRKIFKNQEIVFHLAAVHGGRGYIQTHPADVCSNLSIDHHVFEACSDASVERVSFSSTACVYPTKLQAKVGSDYKLKEEDTNTRDLGGYMSADVEYGWGKLMSEIQLNSFISQYGIRGSPVRYVTAYGPRENETHAIIALIYKALERMDPYAIWGDGNQERDFTYVEDIADGTILAAEKITDGTPINLGTGRRYKMIEVAEMIFKLVNWKPRKIVFEKGKPVGALSRALDNSKAKKLLGWEPKFTLESGLRKTIDWYSRTHKVSGNVDEKILLER